MATIENVARDEDIQNSNKTELTIGVQNRYSVFFFGNILTFSSGIRFVNRKMEKH